MSQATQHPSTAISIVSRYDFSATLDHLKGALTSAGLTVFADIDQQEAAARASLAMPPTRLILFGNPKAGTPVMLANPFTALELPLRAVIREEAGGRVVLDYQDVAQVLVDAYGITPETAAPLARVPAMLRAAIGAT